MAGSAESSSLHFYACLSTDKRLPEAVKAWQSCESWCLKASKYLLKKGTSSTKNKYLFLRYFWTKKNVFQPLASTCCPLFSLCKSRKVFIDGDAMPTLVVHFLQKMEGRLPGGLEVYKTVRNQANPEQAKVTWLCKDAVLRNMFGMTCIVQIIGLL